MGEVYRARDTRLGRVVALKVLPEHLSDASRRERFQREARAVAALNHPHICTVHDVGHDAGIDFLVMELVDGESLAARLERGPLSVDVAIALAIEIADGLSSAHRQGIVHRDLKPGNVMLTKAGSGRRHASHAKLLDFGLASMVRGETLAGAAVAPTETAPLTEAGAVIGTLQYMAPEQLEGRPADPRTDVFAFGALLFEMVTGRRAFEGAASATVVAAILRGDTPSVAASLPAAPRALDRLVRTCLEKDPEDRFASMHDVLLQLRWIAAGDEPQQPARKCRRPAP
jgi:serine/threonine protein kinase